MFGSHTPGEVRQYDLFKLLVLLLLLAALIALLAAFVAARAAPQPTVTATRTIPGTGGSATHPSPLPALSATVAPTSAPTVTFAPTESASTESAPTPEPPTPTAEPSPTVPSFPLTLDLPEGKTAWPNGSVTLHGTGPAGAQIEVLDLGNVIGAIIVGADGNWSLDYGPKNGDHEFAVRPGGASAATTPVLATVTNLRLLDTRDPGKQLCVGPRGLDLGDTFIVARCDVLSIIATRTHLSLAALLEANPVIHDPNLIYPGQVLILPRRPASP